MYRYDAWCIMVVMKSSFGKKKIQQNEQVSHYRDVHVKVRTGQKKQSLSENSVFHLVASVIAKPEQGKANDEVRRLIAVHYGVAFNKIVLVKGSKMTAKIFRVYGIN